MKNTKSIKTKNKKSQIGKKSTKEKENEVYESLSGGKLSKDMKVNSPFPPEMMIKMSYIEPTQILQGASQFLTKRWRITDIYDPDPLLGGGTVSGYNEITKIYGRYRVLKHSFSFTVVNNEPSIPINFGFIMRVDDPTSSIGTVQDCIDSLETSPSTGPKMVGTTGGMSVYRSKIIKTDPGVMLGDKLNYMADSNWTGVTGASPSNNMYLVFIMYSVSGNLTNGCILSINQWYTTRWYGKVNIKE